MKKALDLSGYRDGKLCGEYIREIKRIMPRRQLSFMEVCGTHTQAIFRYGLRDLLPENIRLISGPGCPVCVTPNERIDRIIAYGRGKNNLIATFGDMFRVPGSTTSLEKEKAAGADISIFYSPAESIETAAKNPTRAVILVGVGFETTVPAVAATLLEARKLKLKNWFLFSAHKIVPPAMRALLESGDVGLDGFICPGHVSAIIGSKPYEFIAKDYGKPCVITGFEPVDVLRGIYLLVKQCAEGKSAVEIEYSRIVKPEGNPKALKMIDEVFEVTDSDWRGIGVIPLSGLKIRGKYARFDVEKMMPLEKIEKTRENKGCICGLVLKGVKTPMSCGLFGKACVPEHPVGACMVSSEGTCAAYYKYGR